MPLIHPIPSERYGHPYARLACVLLPCEANSNRAMGRVERSLQLKTTSRCQMCCDHYLLDWLNLEPLNHAGHFKNRTVITHCTCVTG